MSQTNKLYVGNLDYSVTSEELKEFFSKAGEVTDCKVIEGKGFGFITFSSEEASAAAKEAFNETEYKGRKFKIDFARDNQQGGGGGGPRSSFSRGPGGGGGGGFNRDRDRSGGGGGRERSRSRY